MAISSQGSHLTKRGARSVTGAGLPEGDLMSTVSTRRDFLRITAASGVWIAGRQTGFGQEKSPNAKLNVASIGVGGRGRASVDGCRNENLVALCDVDRRQMDKAAKAYPGAKFFTDFRRMLETEKG